MFILENLWKRLQWRLQEWIFKLSNKSIRGAFFYRNYGGSFKVADGKPDLPKQFHDPDPAERVLGADINALKEGGWNELRTINHRSPKGLYPMFQNVLFLDGHISAAYYKRMLTAADYSYSVVSSLHAFW